MADRNGQDPHYEETTAPQNPPNSMVNRDARSGWLASSFGVLGVIFLVVAGVFGWVLVQRELGGREEISRNAEVEGTSGEHQARENSPGGFDPAPQPGNTRDELEFRGLGEPRQGPSAGLDAESITEPSKVSAAPVGSNVRLTDVAVDRVDGDTFWIRAGNSTVAVFAPAGMPTVKAGQQVTISGTIQENAGRRRIRASRIDVK